MKRALVLAIPLVLVAGLATAPVSAAGENQADKVQDAAGAPPSKTDKTPNTGGVAPDKGTTGSVANDGTINDLLSAIADSRTTATAIGAMRQVSRLNVVKVSTMVKGDDARSVANAVKDSGPDHKALQSAIRNNPALNAKLQAKKTKPSRIVAARIEADGTVTIFAD
jgi:hypothetical protein